jgi:uncharacterized protein (TIGR03435 family)
MTLRQNTCAAALMLAIAHGVMGQAVRPAFEIVSVKPSVERGFPDFRPKRSGDRVTMHNVQVPTMVIYAYHLASGAVASSYQLAGKMVFPGGENVFDIDAVAPGTPDDADLRLMFQTLLEERFKLKYHWENREMPLYDLTIAKNGPKLKTSDPNRKVPAGRDAEPGVSHMGGKLSMEVLVEALSARLESPMRNLTGLSGGLYDVDIYFARDISVTTAAPDLVRAVEQELGLKLKPSRGPVPVLVVDRVEKPSEN